jgi:hypothetical protein
LGAVEKATAEAEKHGDRSSELLTALVAEARAMIEKARAVQAERAKAAAEKAAAAAAVEAVAAKAAAADRLRLEEQAAALTLQLQQVQAQLGNSVAPPSPHPEESMCVMCLDAPMDHIIIPCGHQCVCGACAEALKREAHPACPLCREPIVITTKVYLG